MPKRKFYSEEMRDVHRWTSALYEIVHASVYIIIAEGTEAN